MPEPRTPRLSAGQHRTPGREIGRSERVRRRSSPPERVLEAWLAGELLGHGANQTDALCVVLADPIVVLGKGTRRIGLEECRNGPVSKRLTPRSFSLSQGRYHILDNATGLGETEVGVALEHHGEMIRVGEVEEILVETAVAHLPFEHSGGQVR